MHSAMAELIALLAACASFKLNDTFQALIFLARLNVRTRSSRESNFGTDITTATGTTNTTTVTTTVLTERTLELTTLSSWVKPFRIIATGNSDHLLS